jgi:hypothetical protein
MKPNGSKSIHVTFTTQRETSPLVHINNVELPQEDNVKYLGLHLDRRFTWHRHIFAKCKQLGITLTKMYWLLGRQSKLYTSNKLLIYKTIFKPIWTYRIQLWGMASTSNIEIQNVSNWKPCAWYVSNTVIRRDLQIPTVIANANYMESSLCLAVNVSLNRNSLFQTELWV